MKSTSLNKLLEEGIHGVTPGVCVRAYIQGHKKIDELAGKTYEFYDLASLTKIIFATAKIMELYEERKIDIDQTVKQYLPWYPHDKVFIKELLNHSSGQKAWNPYYSSIIKDPSNQDKSYSEILRPLLQGEPLGDNSKSLYSDINFMILGCLLEKVCEKNLVEIWHELNLQYGLRDMNFHWRNRSINSSEAYAPSENCKWRKKKIQGEVFDDNAWALGGVSSNAGLFSNMNDLCEWGLKIRETLFDGIGFCDIFRQSTLRLFTSKSTHKGDWGLGFMKPSRPKSSCGHFFSDEAFGHTGFTGTSIWFDPKVDLLIVILSNRTYPDRDNFRFRDDLRPQIHDWVFRTLVR
ncbi:MAG: serine hydrolase [Pseudomonadota bacterium]|nr:serine hydrolase [Pseudomonadota bacterium]